MHRGTSWLPNTHIESDGLPFRYAPDYSFIIIVDHRKVIEVILGNPHIFQFFESVDFQVLAVSPTLLSPQFSLYLRAETVEHFKLPVSESRPAD